MKLFTAIWFLGGEQTVHLLFGVVQFLGGVDADVNQWIFGIGLGAFYRYGPYSLTKTIDNFAFKFTVTFNI